MHNIEVRYIVPIWQGDKLLKLELSTDQLEVFSRDNEEAWIVESVTYPSLEKECVEGFAVIGFHINDEIKHTPYFIKADGTKVELLCLMDPISKKEWWTEDRKHTKGRYHTGTLFNHSGKIALCIQNYSCCIENSTFSFSVAELENYLADFKGDLWKLILDNNSLTKGNVKKDKAFVSYDELEVFRHFINAVEALIKKPCVKLQENVEKRPIRSIKPTSKTFREYAILPTAQKLSSRVHFESFDTAENRYIHHAVNRVTQLLKTLLVIASQQTNQFIKRIENEKIREKIFENTYKKINKKSFDSEIKTLEFQKKRIEQEIHLFNEWLNETNTSSQPETTMTVVVRFSGVYASSKKEFFIDEIYGHFRKPFYAYQTIQFPFTIDNKAFSDILIGNSFKINMEYISKERKNSKNKLYEIIEVRNVYSIEFIPEELNRLKKKRIEYENSNWQTVWLQEEETDKKQELKNAQKMHSLYTNSLEQYQELKNTIPFLLTRLKTIKCFFQKNNVKMSSYFSSSMIFIQNPLYVTVKTLYNEIQLVRGIDEKTFNQLEYIDEIGLIDIPHLYERWCLVQLIDILCNVYEFQLPVGWYENVLEGIQVKQKGINIKFDKDTRELEMTLSYESPLPSQMRPDFIITLNGKKLILDAKFKIFTEESLSNIIDELYDRKNYSEHGKNQVFILHPNSDYAITTITSPLLWGTNNDYGQSDGCNHTKGSIFLSPTLKHRTLDNLQRLIGMFLQQSFSVERAYNSFELQGEQKYLTCISCGHSGKEITVLQKPTKGNNKKYEIVCHKCQQVTVKTHCKNSVQDLLYKNGAKWTYHRTRAEEIYNIVCPRCEAFFHNRLN